jgi:hypothetical protein
MTALGLAAITFVGAFGGALLGIYIRTKLPPTHLSKESHDVIRLGMGLVATMTALLLGLVTAAAKGTFDSQDATIRNTASGVITLDRLLARYGPETQPTRVALRRVVAMRMEAVWPEDRRTPADLAEPQSAALARPPAEEIEDQILALAPQTDTKRWLKAESLKLTEEVLRARWRVLGSAGGSVLRAFLVVVIFWVSMTFASFGLAAPRNATVVGVFAMSALSVAAAVFLIVELDGPFEGLVRVSKEPFALVLSQLNR